MILVAHQSNQTTKTMYQQSYDERSTHSSGRRIQQYKELQETPREIMPKTLHGEGKGVKKCSTRL